MKKNEGRVKYDTCKNQKEANKKINLLLEDFPDAEIYIGFNVESKRATHFKLGDKYIEVGTGDIVSEIED